MRTNEWMVVRICVCLTQNAMQPNQFSASVGTRALDEYEMSNRKKPKSFILLTWGFPFNADADAEVGYKCSSLRTNTNTLHIFQVNIPNCLARSFYWHKSKPKWSHSFGLFVAREEKRVCYHHITPNWRDRWTALNLVHQFFVLRCTFFFYCSFEFSLFNKRHQKSAWQLPDLIYSRSRIRNTSESKIKKHDKITNGEWERDEVEKKQLWMCLDVWLRVWWNVCDDFENPNEITTRIWNVLTTKSVAHICRMSNTCLISWCQLVYSITAI